ncbi:MAG: ribosome silencing factor [Akkermansiaceae bacterium]
MLHFPFPVYPQIRREFIPNRRLFYRYYPLSSPMAIEGKKLAIACAQAAEEIQAEDIRVIDLTGLSSLTDFMVVCSGTSLPHLRAVMRDVEKKLIEEYNVRPVNAEGNADSRWVVLDFIDVMVHIMHHEMRDLYALEDLWAGGKDVVWQENTPE